MSNNVQTSVDNDNNNNLSEIEILDLVKLLWRKRFLIIKITVIFMIVGLVIALVSPKQYSATCIFVQQATDKKVSGSISSLAAVAGISLGEITNNEVISPKIYSKLLNNVELNKELINTKIKFESFDEPVSLLDYYTKKDYQKFSFFSFIQKYTIGLPRTILNAIKGGDKAKDTMDEEILNSEGSAIQRVSKEELECIKILKGQINLFLNEKDGYISLSANMPEANAAAELVNRVQFLLQKYVIELKINKAQDNLNFITERYREAKAEYNIKQATYAKFKDANKSLSSALAQINEEKMKEEYNLAYSLYSELAKQLIQSEIKVKENTPMFAIIEPAVVPLERIKPKRSKILIVWTFLGLFVSCGSIIGLDYLGKLLNKNILKN